MGEDMDMFPKVEEYFENLNTGFAKFDDITPYFEKKGEFLEQILILFMKRDIRLEQAAHPIREKNETDKNPAAHESEESTENNETKILEPNDLFENEDILIEVFNEMLQEKNEPHIYDLATLHFRLTALVLLYNCIRPKQISFDTILKLDLVTMQIVSLACVAIGKIDRQVKEWEGLVNLWQSNCGRPKSDLTKAVEYLWNKFETAGKTEYLKKGNTNNFIIKLKSALNESSPEYDDYIAEKIEKITRTHTGWKITPQGSEAVSQTAVSTTLSRLRAKKDPER